MPPIRRRLSRRCWSYSKRDVLKWSNPPSPIRSADSLCLRAQGFMNAAPRWTVIDPTIFRIFPTFVEQYPAQEVSRVNCYLVRIIGSRDLVGIFFAWDIIELVMLIDECLDPSICEFTELPPGSLYWSEPSVVVPIRRRRNETDDDIDDNDGIPWSDVSLSDSWWGSLHTRQRPDRAHELRKRKKRGRKRPKRKSAQIILFQRKDKPEK